MPNAYLCDAVKALQQSADCLWATPPPPPPPRIGLHVCAVIVCTKYTANILISQLLHQISITVLSISRRLLHVSCYIRFFMQIIALPAHIVCTHLVVCLPFSLSAGRPFRRRKTSEEKLSAEKKNNSRPHSKMVSARFVASLAQIAIS